MDGQIALLDLDNTKKRISVKTQIRGSVTNSAMGALLQETEPQKHLHTGQQLNADEGMLKIVKY